MWSVATNTNGFIGSPRRTERGLTLVELLIVVALIAMLSAAVVFGSGMFGASRQRAAAAMIVSGIRTAFTRANATGRPVRLVFDLEENLVSLEETASAVMLRENDEEESTGAGAEPVTEVERAAREESEAILKGPRAPRPSFRPVKEFGFQTDGKEGRELGKGVSFRMVQTEHDGQERTEGRAYLYFWPGGGTEHAVIQLHQGKDDDGLTVVVSPLTGRAKIVRGEVGLPEPRSDGEYSEREERL